MIENNRQFISANLQTKLCSINKIEIDFKLSKDNLKIPALDNRILHSLYYPMNESRKINFSSDKNSLCIAIGFGAGYHLHNYAQNGGKIIVIPVDLNLLINVLDNIDLSSFLDFEKISLISLEEVIHHFNINEYNKYYFVIHPVLQQLFPDKITKIIHSIKQVLNPEMIENNTIKKFGFIWHKNIMKNIIYYFDVGYDLSPLIITKPVLITGAGPSLQQNILSIKHHRNCFYIASTDTSLNILINNDIIPDSVFTFDAQNYSNLHFLKCNTKTRLFSDFTSPVRVENICQTMLFSNHPFSRIFFDSGFYEILLPSDSRNIGGAIIDFFHKYFSGLPILSVGIDFGCYDLYQYSNGSYISDIFMMKSSYFDSQDKGHSSLFYKNIYHERSGKWSSMDLFTDYSSNTNHDIYTFSDSPYTNFIKTNIEDFLGKQFISKEFILNFKKPTVTRSEFYNKISYFLNNDIAPIQPYLLSLDLEPTRHNINQILNEMKKYFL